MLENAIRIAQEHDAQIPRTAAGREEFLQTFIKEILTSALADRLGIRAETINSQVPITHYGVDSLGAVEIAHIVERACRVTLSFEVLLEGLSIDEIASKASADSASESRSLAFFPTNQPVDDTEWNLSPGQEALLHIHRQSPSSPAYNIATAMRIMSVLDQDLLRKCLGVLVDRHPLLRVTFLQTEGRTVQQIHKSIDLPFSVENSADWTDKTIESRISEEQRRPFNLETGPLFRVSLWTRGGRDHVLVIVLHHIIADLWSVAMLLRELFTLYEHQGRSSMPPPPASYANYVEWQRKMLESSQGDDHWQYWQNQLRGTHEVLEIPTDRARPDINTYRGACEVNILDEETTTGLKQLSTQCGVTLHMTLLAIYAVLLHRYTEQDDITVGSALAGRSKPEWATVFGYFVNSLPLTTYFPKQQIFAQFLKHVQRTVIEALDHQDYPLSTLVSRLRPARIPGRSPLFETLFVFQQSPFANMPELTAFALGLGGSKILLGGLQLESVVIESQATTFDLTFMVGDLGREIGISVKFNTDLFDGATIRRMLGHFQTIARAVLQTPTAPISSLPLLTKAEQQMLRVQWNPKRPTTSSAVPGLHCISDLFEEQVKENPNNCAVVFEDQHWTYGQLSDRATEVAAHLHRVGVGPEVQVVVYLERGADMIAAILGILKAGGTYVPLDTAEPTIRMASMFLTVQPRVILTRSNLVDRFAGIGSVERYIDIEACYSDALNGPEHAIQGPKDPASAAYIIFTSGSTGAPRGVCVERRHLINYVQAICGRIGIFSGASCATVSTIAADLGNTMIFAALCTGGTLHVISSERALSPSAFAQYVSQNPIDFLKIVPSHLDSLLNGTATAAILPRRCLILGGESPSRRLVEKIRALAPDTRILNHYGPTETTVGVLTHDAGAVLEDNTVPTIPIGRPLDHVQAYILDAHMQLVPIGVRGELYIGGGSVARGYYNLPSITADRFIPDPFSDRPGSRLYRTGDLAHYRANGAIDFQGRKDKQIKLRGFRVELGEIEAVLERHPAIQQAVVLCVDRALTGTHLVGYVVSAESELQPQDLRSFVKEQLPDYMAPSSIIILGKLPITANGKLDQKALLEIAPEPLAHDATVEASTPLEIALVSLWKQLLGAEVIGVNDDFFELGGHSLMATQMTSRLEKLFPSDTPLLVQFFQTPTVAGLAEAILAETTDSSQIDEAIEEIEQMVFSWQM